MDTLSHTVLGACIGEAMLGKKIGKKAMLWGALANNLPDIDVFFTPLFNPEDALFIHRGITHSFLFAILLAPILGWIFSRSCRFSKPERPEFREWTLFFLIALIAHPLLDSCTLYGTGIFEPFSHYRAQFTSLFIVEPLYTLPLLIGFIAILILKKDSLKRKFWAKFGLYLSTIYLLFSISNKLYVEKIFSDSLRKQNHNFTELYSSPTPLNNILWDVFAKDTNGYWFGFYSHFDKTKDVEFSFIPRNDSLAGDLLPNEAVQKLIRFSRGYYCFTRCDDELRFNDLRFAFSGEFSCNADRKNFVFSFALKKNPSAPYGIEVKRSSWGTSRFMGFSKLVERIKGV
ncbi:MAG: metal-dependent hydrolase [Bacteroidetes bacterium]|nr:metal-dependent hydrolase [Bacteroidota bacterium]